MIFTLFQQMILCSQLTDVARKSNQAILIRLFVATVESILLYGSETWTLTESLIKLIDDCYVKDGIERRLEAAQDQQGSPWCPTKNNYENPEAQDATSEPYPLVANRVVFTTLGSKSWSEEQEETSHDLCRQYTG